MQEYKSYLGIATLVIATFSYELYCKDIFKGRTKSSQETTATFALNGAQVIISLSVINAITFITV